MSTDSQLICGSHYCTYR